MEWRVDMNFIGDQNQRDRDPTLWLFEDGKPGHVNQLLGLTEAIDRLVGANGADTKSVSIKRYEVSRKRFAFPRLVANNADVPDLILCAGHATHLSALLASRSYHCPVIVLMKPSLPFSWFDLCLIPEHDDAAPRSNVVLTCGVLNRIRANRVGPRRGQLVLIGGPSKHYDWDEGLLVRQIQELVISGSDRQLAIGTSRRTPLSTIAALQSLQTDRISLVLAEETTPEWLPEQLANVESVWVTEDSVSMLYESLSAGACVGLLPVPQRKATRLTRAAETLVARNWVTHFEKWRRTHELPPPKKTLNEAERCARLVFDRFFKAGSESVRRAA